MTGRGYSNRGTTTAVSGAFRPIATAAVSDFGAIEVTTGGDAPSNLAIGAAATPTLRAYRSA